MKVIEPNALAVELTSSLVVDSRSDTVRVENCRGLAG